MSKHDHIPPPPPCQHESLRFCAQCDTVECTACGKEWKAASPPMPYKGVRNPNVRVTLAHANHYDGEHRSA